MLDLLSSSNISDEDIENLKKECKNFTDFYVAKGLIFELYSWLLLEDTSKIREVCEKIKKDPILSNNSELMKRVRSGGLSQKDIPYVKKLQNSFSSKRGI